MKKYVRKYTQKRIEGNSVTDIGAEQGNWGNRFKYRACCSGNKCRRLHV